MYIKCLCLDSDGFLTPQNYNTRMNKTNFQLDICYKKCLFYRKDEAKNGIFKHSD